MQKNLLTLKEVAELLNMSIATINYYTNLGLFEVSDRRGNKRLYSKEKIMEKYARIREMRKQGYSLGLIQRMMITGTEENNVGGL